MPPTFGNGKICYLEIPAHNTAASADFYRDIFGWNIRTRDDGSVAFDDGVGEVSGTWVTGRGPLGPDAGIVVHLMVDDAEDILRQVVEQGGAVVAPVTGTGQERYARFRDPAGNVLGIFQQ